MCYIITTIFLSMVLLSYVISPILLLNDVLKKKAKPMATKRQQLAY